MKLQAENTIEGLKQSNASHEKRAPGAFTHRFMMRLLTAMSMGSIVLLMGIDDHLSTAHASNLDDKDTPPEHQTKGTIVSTTSFSDMQIKVLQRLESRRADLKKWEERLKVREETLKSAETALAKRHQELEKLREEIRAVYKAEEDKEGERLAAMAKAICLNLKPSKAARILGEMDEELVLRMLSHVPDKRLSEILARMEPEQAAKLSQKYVLTRVKLPSAPGI